MLIYQPIKVPISVFHHCNTLTTSNHSDYESHTMNQSSTQAALPQES